MPLIFSYGTLQDEHVQLATFGRTLEGAPDALVGYERVSLTFTDPVLIASSGRAVHANLERSPSRQARVAGTVLILTDSELALCDAYELQARYRRQLLTLESGKQAWVYSFDGNRGQ